MEFVRPDNLVVSIKNKDGSTYLEAPAIELDMLLSKAQAGLDPTDPFNVDTWVDRFRELLLETYDCLDEENLSRQDAWIICRATNCTIDSLKKNLPPLLM